MALIKVGRPPFTAAERKLVRELKSEFLRARKQEAVLERFEARVGTIDLHLAAMSTLLTAGLVPASVIGKGQRALESEKRALVNVVRSARMFGKPRGSKQPEQAAPVALPAPAVIPAEVPAQIAEVATA